MSENSPKQILIVNDEVMLLRLMREALAARLRYEVCVPEIEPL